MRRIADILRYPLKSHGREPLDQVALSAGHAMPYDRLWAVAHDASKVDGTGWAPCVNFSRVSKAPALMAITSCLDEGSGKLTLEHPARETLTFDPDSESDRFIDWVMPLVPPDRARPARVVKLAGRGFTDSDFPSVTLCNHSSHRAVAQRLGQPLSIHRWRGNFWFESNEPWVEFEWLGRDLRIGEAVLRVRERTDRCLATTANPDTGQRDLDTLGALDSWGHQDFSVRAEVVQGGAVRIGDTLEVL